jgi:hypothetical protein
MSNARRFLPYGDEDLAAALRCMGAPVPLHSPADDGRLALPELLYSEELADAMQAELIHRCISRIAEETREGKRVADGFAESTRQADGAAQDLLDALAEVDGQVDDQEGRLPSMPESPDDFAAER